MATTIPQVARAMREVLTTTADAAAKATQFGPPGATGGFFTVRGKYAAQAKGDENYNFR